MDHSNYKPGPSREQLIKSISSNIVLIRSFWFSKTQTIFSRCTTGIIVDGSLILTTAHGLYQQQYQYCSFIEVSFCLGSGGKISNLSPIIRIPITIDTVSRNIDKVWNGENNNVFALVKLPTDKIIEQLSKAKNKVILASNINHINNPEYFVVGFPEMKAQDSHQGVELKYMRFSKKLEQFNLQSGSPIFMSKRADDLQELVLVGVYISQKANVIHPLINVETAQKINAQISHLTKKGKNAEISHEVIDNNQIQLLISEFSLPENSNARYIQKAPFLQANGFSEIKDLCINFLPYYQSIVEKHHLQNSIDFIRTSFNMLKYNVVQPFFICLDDSCKVAADYKQGPRQESGQYVGSNGKERRKLDQFFQSQFPILSSQLILQYEANFQNQFQSFFGLITDRFKHLRKHLFDELHKQHTKNTKVGELSKQKFEFEQANAIKFTEVKINEKRRQEFRAGPQIEQYYYIQNSCKQEPLFLMASQNIIHNYYTEATIDKLNEPIGQNERIDCPESQEQINLKPILKAWQLKCHLQKTEHSAQQIEREKISENISQQSIQAIEEKQMSCSKCESSISPEQYFIWLRNDCHVRNTNICSDCADNCQQDNVLRAEKSSLTSFFRKFNQSIYPNDSQIRDISQKVSVVANLLNMNLLKKMLEDFTKKIMKTLLFLNSLLFKDEKDISQAVTQILNGNPDELYKLYLNHNLIKLTQQLQIGYMLQSTVDQVKLLANQNYERFRDSLEQLRLKIPNFEEQFDSQEYVSRMKAKYQSIINIKNQEEFIIAPTNLYEVSQEYYKFIKEIVIIKDTEQYFQEELLKQKKNRRKQFWLQMQKKRQAIKQQISATTSFVNKLDFINSQYIWQLEELLPIDIQEHLLSSDTQDEIDSKIHLYLYRYFCKFRQWERLKWKRLPLNVIQVVLSKKITNLVRLQIRYKNLSYSQCDQQYGVEAVKLFQIMDQNPNLNYFAIQGVRILRFKRFICNFWKLHSNSKSNCQQYGFSQIQKQAILRLKVQKKISLDWSIIYQIENEDDIQSLSYFVRIFSPLPKLKAILITSNYHYQEQIERFIRSFVQRLENCYIQQFNLHQQFKRFSFESIFLNDITKITSIYILRPCLYKTRQFLEVYAIFAEKKNGETFPKKLDDAKYIDFRASEPIQNIDFEKYQEEVNQSTLQLILEEFMQALIWNAERQQSYQVNKDYIISLMDTQTFKIIGRSISNNYLILIPSAYSRVKILNISQCNFIGDYFADAIFAELSKITSLEISKIRITAGKVLMIPSKELERLGMGQLKGVNDVLLRSIDVKWPMLKSLSIFGCKEVSPQGINAKAFRNLSELQITPGILDEGTKFKLLLRGVEILPFC